MGKSNLVQFVFEISMGLVFVLLLFCLFVDINAPTMDIPKPVDTVNAPIRITDTFSESLLKQEISADSIKFPEIVYAQARLETGNFTSKYFKERNNLFGFRARNGYMYFRDWRDCVRFYSNWQKKYYKSGDYYQFLLDINYAEDSTYINKVKGCIKSKHGF